jgi:hypothetical protein
MTVHDTRETVASPTIPGPRQPEPETVPTMVALPEDTGPVPPKARGEYPWPEPWHYSLGARPRSEFWNVATASWQSRGPYPDRSANS